MKGVGSPGCSVDCWRERSLRQRQVPPNRRIGLKVRVVHGDDGVVGVVPAEQKDADQSAIIRPALRQRRQDAERTQRERSNGGRANTYESTTSKHDRSSLLNDLVFGGR